MNKRSILTIFLVAILSISLIQIGSIAAYNDGLYFYDDSQDYYDIQEDYDIAYNDSDGLNGDFNIADVNYTTNFDTNPVNRFFFGDTVDIYFDGESTQITTNLDSSIQQEASEEILDYVSSSIFNTSADVDSIREGVREICSKYGAIDCTVNIDSIIGEDQIPYIVWAHGKSMLPTIQDGQYVLVNKTNDIHVGDIVSVNSKEYGGIMKRVDKINGNDVYLVSDNKKVYYETIDGITYESKGLCTWVDISEIEGVAIQY